MNDRKIRFKTSEVFEKNFNTEKRIVVNRGGTRSTKSFSICQIAVCWLLTGRIGLNIFDERGTFSICRKWFPSLRATTIKDFIEILESTGMSELVEHNKNDKEFRFENRVVDYFSLDDEMKIRGRKRNHLFIDEANEIDRGEFQQLIFRTIGRVFLALNPSNPNHFIKTEIEDVRRVTEKDVEIVVSSYLDNPFLEQSVKKEIELLRNNDPGLWNIYGRGEWSQVENLIFSNVNFVEKIEGEISGFGLDFGFTNDPSALIEVRKMNGELFVQTLFYQRGLTNSDIAKKLNELKIDKLKPIVADSAEPKSIEELYRSGFRNIEPAKKGRDSIRSSIDILRRFKINCLPGDPIAKEFQTYKFRIDKNLNQTDEPIDFNNHSIDAFRYFALNRLTMVKKGIYQFR